jgi:hypothetical protein
MFICRYVLARKITKVNLKKKTDLQNNVRIMDNFVTIPFGWRLIF